MVMLSYNKTLDSELDEYCSKILLVMMTKRVTEQLPKGFNQLFKLINSSGISEKGISRPTFNEHINHLINKRYVERQETKTQKVLYYLKSNNPKIEKALEELGDLVVIGKIVSKNIKEKKISPSDFVFFVSDFADLIILYQMQTMLKLSQEKIFDYGIAFNIQNMCVTSLYQLIMELFSTEKAKEWREITIQQLDQALAKKANNIKKILQTSDEELGI